ncbi:uncharacterized protein LOC123529027 [Mercenaria mercenaria]|uniref:uncharacterized protein LOC123529027 n=1 Tax=Mercenaria mercenaria TaxID=6596 RepID=UPI00234F3CB5|nr:uncharacterized protein LOC123529027 [Mercenaria mercenaria]XP_053377393.1 uncharacterized protein LOC123529027 [Mercenaria mercenaria]
MNGSLIPYTPIAVDFWKIRECPQARIFFLTHLHGDHITGLTSSWSYPIYCSEITGKLLVKRHGVREDLIHSLQTECAEIIYLDNEHQQQMTVTAIDANHCPGAVMFLMQGYFGTILHTGDFRYHSDMVNQSVLSCLSGKVDILYLDNTYCSPSCVFPTRDEATSQIVELIEQHPTKDVLIGMRNLGKEKLLSNIALHFQEWISVPDKFYQTLEIIGAPDVFDNGATKHRIRVVPFHVVSNKFVQQVNQKYETIVILPTALYHGIEATPYENNDKVFVVPYSDHSSYTELRDFVAFIKPKKIIPIVKSNARGPFGLGIADRADMSCFAKFTSDGWNSKIDIPVSVQAFMHCRYSKIMAMEKKGQKRKAKQKQPQTKKVKRGIYYDSPKSASKDNVNEGVYSTENGKNNSKISEEDTLQVKRILFEDETPKRKAADGLKVQKGERKRTKGEHIIQNCVKDFDCTKQNSAERMELTTKDKNGKKYCDAVVDLLDRQQKLISRHYRNKKSELEVAMPQERSFGNVEKRKEKGIKVKGPKTQDSLELEGEQPRQHVHKKTSVKMPLKFVSSKQDSAFDSAVGLRTYSKSNAKMFNSVNPIVKSNARGPFGLGIADRADMSCFAKFTSGSWNSKVDIPIPDQAFMHCRYSKIMAMEKKGQKRKAKLKQPQTKKVKRVIDYDSPKSASKDNVSKGVCSTESEKNNSKISKKDTLQVKRILFEDETPKRKAADGLKVQKGEIKRTKGEHIIQNCVKDFDCTKQNSAERMELTTKDKNGKKYCDAVVDLLDRQQKLISRHYRNKKSELEVAMPQERSVGNVGKRKEKGIKVKGPKNNLKNNRVILIEDDFDNEDEFVQTNLSEFNEHNEKGGGSEQEEGTLIIVTDSEDEPEEPNVVKKDARKDGLKEKLEDSVYEHDISNESIIAQAGTQVFSKSFSMETGLLDRDKVNVNIKSKHKAGTDEIEQVEDSFPVLDTTKEINTASEKDNSGSCIEKVNETGHTNDQFKTSTASSSLVSHENTKLIVLEPSNEDNSCLAVEDLSTVVNIGTQNGIMAVERTDDMAYNIDREIMPNAGSEEDNNMSTIVNIGTQKEIRRVESSEGTSDVGSEIFADLGEETLCNNSRKSMSKVDRNSKGYCRKCELDAFRQVLERLDNCKLKKELKESQNEAGDTGQVTSRCKAKQGYKQYTKCSFAVKPVRL